MKPVAIQGSGILSYLHHQHHLQPLLSHISAIICIIIVVRACYERIVVICIICAGYHTREQKNKYETCSKRKYAGYKRDQLWPLIGWFWTCFISLLKRKSSQQICQYLFYVCAVHSIVLIRPLIFSLCLSRPCLFYYYHKLSNKQPV